MVKTRGKNPLSAIFHGAKTLKAKMQCLHTKIDNIVIPLGNGEEVQAHGCDVYTNLQTGHSTIDKCESVTKVTNRVQQRPLNMIDAGTINTKEQ